MMKFYTKIINEKTKECLIINQIEAKNQGLQEMEVDFGYDGKAYLKGYAPQKPLEELKEEKLNELKRNIKQEILTAYPYHKQLNIIRSGGEELDKMSNFIDGIRKKHNEYEKKINSCTSLEELKEIKK